MKENTSGQAFRITVEDLTKTFNKELIVRNFSYQFSTGTTTAITGSNGSGKSTLLKLLSGIIVPNKGKITYEHQKKLIPDEKWFRHISFCSPAQELIEEFTLKEIVDFHLRFKKFEENFSKEDFYEIAYFSEHINKKIALFSSGMKQRLKLALAMFTQSNVLFLDEPTTNMDLEGIKWYRENIIKIVPNRLVVIASNQKHEYEFCDQLISIADYKRH
ncbi:MAG: ABC transporter ATP-binding protein [Bacteroidota bacterium]